MLTTALAGLTSCPQWFVWHLSWLPAKQKYEKIPVYRDGTKGMNGQDPANWLPYEIACSDLALFRARGDGEVYTLGFMFTENLGYWFLDIDGCKQPDGTITPWAQWFNDNLPGAFVEWSSSNRGLHFLGRGQVPQHRTRPTQDWLKANPGNDIEFYTGARGIAFGLSGQAWGNADSDHTAATHWIVENIFKPDPKQDLVTTGLGPRADWRGPTDDNDLLRRAFAAPRSAAKIFAGEAGFADLWTRNVPVLARTYPYSGDKDAQFGETEADYALAIYLAFWTGCDGERMERLMMASALRRPKWHEHRTYLRELTIARACQAQTVVCCDKEVEQKLVSVTTVEATTSRMDYHEQIMHAGDDAELRNVVIPAIANDRSLVALDRDFLAAAVKKRLNEWLFPVSISDCREMLRVRVVEDDESIEVAPEWANRHVYVMAGDEFFDLQSATGLSRTAFNAQYNRLMPQRGNGDREDAAKWCLERWNMATVNDSMYWPGKEPVFQYESRWYANLYSPATLPELAADYTTEGVAAINAFCAHVKAFCGHRPEVYMNLLDWMAWNVQNPGTKCRYAPLLKGVQGDGKTLIVSAMRAAMGGANVGSVGPNLLCADFNDWAEGTCVTGFEEMMINGRKRWAVANAVKEPVSNNTLSINRKGRASGKTIQNVTNYIAFTNYVDAIPLEDSDRRWWIVFSPYTSQAAMQQGMGLSAEEMTKHFDLIFDSFTDHRRGQWRKFLSEYKVSDAFRPNGHAPETPEKREMQSSGEDAAEAVARQVIEAGGIGVGRSVLSSSALTSLMRTICVQDGVDVPKTSAVSHMLTRLGFSQIRSVYWEGKTHRIWWRRGEVLNDDPATLRSLLDHTKVLDSLKLSGV